MHKKAQLVENNSFQADTHFP